VAAQGREREPDQAERGKARRDRLSEDLVVALGLLFKPLAPLRNVAAIKNCSRGIEAMALEEAAYWLGRPCMHRKNPKPQAGAGGVATAVEYGLNWRKCTNQSD
jgi:hypothetical protein